jgi:hypothetical protein
MNPRALAQKFRGCVKHDLHALFPHHPADLSNHYVFIGDAIQPTELNPAAKVHFVNLDSVFHNDVAG